jgi:hypothetical protein
VVLPPLRQTASCVQSFLLFVLNFIKSWSKSIVNAHHLLKVPTNFVGGPKVFVGRPNIFVGCPKVSVGHPNIFVGRPKVFVGQLGQNTHKFAQNIRP